MVRAYDLVYLEPAQDNLAVLFDYSVNFLKIPLDKFYRRFLQSIVSKKFEMGDYSVIVGKSGVELVKDLIDGPVDEVEYQITSRSPEYWLGHSLAYFQWATSLPFRKLNKYISIEELLSMYSPYHEMNINQFVDRVIQIYNERKKYTNLQIIRKALGCSRHLLSLISGVPERTIEQYEQRRKNINKANAEHIVAMAKALKIPAEELLEI